MLWCMVRTWGGAGGWGFSGCRRDEEGADVEQLDVE